MAPRREPRQECAKHEPSLGRKRHVRGDAYDDAERQAQHGSERDGASGLHVRECTVTVGAGTTALDNNAVALCLKPADLTRRAPPRLVTECTAALDGNAFSTRGCVPWCSPVPQYGAVPPFLA